MKYGLGYTLVTRTTGLLSRTLFYFRRTELNYMLNLLKDEKGKKILDYGCNTGYFCNLINKVAPGNKVFGADINKYALNYSRKKYKDIKFHQVDEKFFKNNKFDIIVMSHVLEHIKDRGKIIKDLSKMLTKNGKLIVAVPQERVRGDATIFQLAYNCLRLKFENPHVAKLEYDDLKELFNKAGIKIEAESYTNYFFPLKSNKRKFYAWSLVVSGSKT